MKPSLRCKGPFKIKTLTSVTLESHWIDPMQMAPGWTLKAQLQLLQEVFLERVNVPEKVSARYSSCSFLSPIALSYYPVKNYFSLLSTRLLHVNLVAPRKYVSKV